MNVTEFESGKADIVKQYRTHDTDTGSPEVQVALLTSRIAYLTECRYPDGTQVLCSASASVADGLIIRLTGLQVWDD